MLDQDNFVGRLRALALSLAQHREGAVTDVLGRALDTNPRGVEFHRRVALLVEVAERAQAQVTELAADPSQELYTEALTAIVQTLQKLDMRENWSNYVAAFSPRALTLLETCERATARHLNVIPPSEDALKAVLADIQEAINNLLKADVEDEVKQLLLEMLREVEGSLLAYAISGLAGVRHAVERTLGVAVLHQKTLKQSRAQETIKMTFKALAGVINLLRNLDFLRQLPEKVQEILCLPQ
jgi:hypothetical protein